MSFDLVIKGGLVVDGTGAAGFHADVGIKNGRIAEIGKLSAGAAQTINADQLVVAPGVVDVHTHYDAQLCWDGVLGSSAAHGITTAIQGNCGIGVAPCRPEHRDVVLKDLVVLEGIAYDILKAGIDWNFETFPQYLDAMRSRGLGINVAPLVPLSTLRRYTLGDEATERAATPLERAELVKNLREAMQAGALGFSATLVGRQTGYMGKPLPCQLADSAELAAYGKVLRELGYGAIQVNVVSSVAQPTDDELAILDLLLTASGRTVTYSGAMYRNDDPEAVERMLCKVEPLRKRGAIPQTPVTQVMVELDLRTPYIFSDTPAFKKVLNRPVEEQKRIYRDPAWRAQVRAELAQGGRLFSNSWRTAVVLRVNNEALRPLLQKSIEQIAAERRADPVDVMFDLALEDNLELKYLGDMVNTSPEHLAKHIKDPRVMVGSGDAGAHFDMLFQGGFPTYMLGHWVREKQAVTLEHAIRRMTSEPADYFGLADRGRLQAGKAADIMIFDPGTVNSAARANQVLYDMPGGGMRLNANATGMQHVIVNGAELIKHGRHTGAMSGRFINGGRAQ